MRALSLSVLSRRDADTARLVDLAVSAKDTDGTRAAATILAKANIDLKVAVRVLSQPDRRRGRIKRLLAPIQ